MRSASSSRTACGSRLIPTPRGWTRPTRSYTSTRIPISWMLSAVARPPMPAPMTITRGVPAAIASGDLVDFEAHGVAAALAGRHRQEIVHPGESRRRGPQADVGPEVVLGRIDRLA